jgi:hypothetical protein
MGLKSAASFDKLRTLSLSKCSINPEPLGFTRGLEPFDTLKALSLSKGIPRTLVLSAVEGSVRGVEWVDFLKILCKISYIRDETFRG